MPMKGATDMTRHDANPLNKVPRAQVVALKREGMSDEKVAEHFTARLGQHVSKDNVASYRRRQRIDSLPKAFAGPPEAMLAGALKASAIARANRIEANDFAAIAIDKGRERQLFAGLSFSDHPRAMPSGSIGYLKGRPEPSFSPTGSTAAMAAL
jgi:hypothetical protein